MVRSSLSLSLFFLAAFDGLALCLMLGRIFMEWVLNLINLRTVDLLSSGFDDTPSSNTWPLPVCKRSSMVRTHRFNALFGVLRCS